MFNWFRRKSHPNIVPTEVVSELAEKPVSEPSVPVYMGNCPAERWDTIEFAFTSGGVHYFKFNC